MRSLAGAFAALACITVGSWLIAEADWFAAVVPSVSIETLVIMMAGAKMLLIAESFMELHHAPRWLRGMMAGWTATIVLMVAILNGMGAGYDPHE